MQVHKVREGQNIFDVAIELHGTIEGVIDLLINNPLLSFDTRLKGGDELNYLGDVVINQDMIDTLHRYNVSCLNGEGNVYLKECSKPLLYRIKSQNIPTNFEIELSGEGVLCIDWGDNSEVEEVLLTKAPMLVSHYFNTIEKEREVRFYGDVQFTKYFLRNYNGQLDFRKPVVIDEVTLDRNTTGLNFLLLSKGLRKLDIANMKIDSLIPIYNADISKLSLKNISSDNRDWLNNYLIYIATHHNERRACDVYLDAVPSGLYQEPKKDSNGRYIIESGMEAIYVILHDVEWNSPKPWSFNIAGTLLTANKRDGFPYTLPLTLL